MIVGVMAWLMTVFSWFCSRLYMYWRHICWRPRSVLAMTGKVFLGSVFFRAVFLGSVFFIVIAAPAYGQSINLDFSDGPSATGRILQFFILLTVITLAPSILVMMTSFVRIVVVLSFLRTALGLQQTPPNVVLIGLSLFLTLFIMLPTFEAAYNNGVAPLVEEEISEEVALDRAARPFHDFMAAQTRQKDLALFMDVADIDAVDTPADVPYRVLIPAFMISELRRAFEIGFLLFVPFLIIDMVVASILMSMGMMMLPPIIISLPFKLVFFVLVDGWYLVAGSLVESFNAPLTSGGS